MARLEEALRLREQVVHAGCSKDYEHLPRVADNFDVRPTEEELRGLGIGHLVGDRPLVSQESPCIDMHQRAAALFDHEPKFSKGELFENAVIHRCYALWRLGAL